MALAKPLRRLPNRFFSVFSNCHQLLGCMDNPRGIKLDQSQLHSRSYTIWSTCSNGCCTHAAFPLLRTSRHVPLRYGGQGLPLAHPKCEREQWCKGVREVMMALSGDGQRQTGGGSVVLTLQAAWYNYKLKRDQRQRRSVGIQGHVWPSFPCA